MRSAACDGWRRLREPVLKAPDYSDRVRALFADPQHAGVAAGPRVHVDRGGFTVELSADADDGVLSRLCFRVFCERFEGRACADLAHFGAQELLEELGIPVEKTGRILLLEDAVRALATRLGARSTD